MKNSIHRQMQIWLMIPLLILLIVSAVCSFVLATLLSREVYDKTLLNSIDSIASRIKFAEDKLTVKLLPPSTIKLFTHSHMDVFLFEIYTVDGELLTPDVGLPKPPPRLKPDEEPELRYTTVNGEEFRVVADRVDLENAPIKTIIIQAGETRHARKEHRYKIFIAMLIPQAILGGLAFLAIWASIEQGLKPLKTIGDLVKRRSPLDLSPIRPEETPVEVESFLTALNGLLDRVRDDVVRQQRFAGNAAHQLRTPLAGLKTYLEVMEKLSKDPELRPMLKEMRDGVDRIVRTVQQLLSLSRKEQDPAGDLDFGSIDLNAVVEEAAMEVVPESLKRNIELNLDCPDSPVTITGDPISLKELIVNLLDNAIKYNTAGGHVSVQVQCTDGVNGSNARLMVEDDGVGIPEEERINVFERFYRISRADTLEVTGSGLGLSIVAEIARLHGATVTIDSAAGAKGTRVLVSFPAPT